MITRHHHSDRHIYRGKEDCHIHRDKETPESPTSYAKPIRFANKPPHRLSVIHQDVIYATKCTFTRTKRCAPCLNVDEQNAEPPQSLVFGNDYLGNSLILAGILANACQ
mmetsp:Transcript_12451/g.26888  ORF Transcript_12451/g.26888 Transcript_12451/m.26888 type:complete len:109 (+) Transcript_12451:195-521(+)